MVRKKKSKPVEGKIVHTKRREVEDSDGWTHIVDTPRANKALPKSTGFHGGDFEINGVSYINRTLEEMKGDFEHWKKAWDESEACKTLKEMLEGLEIENVVVLGLGSLQSSRREGRRASATQLAALQTITTDSRTPVILQDPQYTELDKEFLFTLGYKVVEDPGAFAEVKKGSLVYAIHCYGPVYKRIGDGPRPVVLIGTDVENFGRFDGYDLVKLLGIILIIYRSNPGIKESLEELVEGCQSFDFPQVRHDFSDTKIYWRKGETAKP